ncbi:MAG: YbiU family protein, partial [Devosia sp.]
MMNMSDAKPEFDVAEQIVAFKRSMAPRREALKRAFGEVKDAVSRAADKIRTENAAGRSTIPELSYRDIKDRKVSDATRAAIRSTGCAVIRGVFPQNQATEWFDEVGRYLEDNQYERKEVEKRSLDKYFSALKAGRPQIFNVYWSRPQVLARQDEKLAETRSFLDRLWINYDGIFDPDLQCAYADRVRRRQPGDKTLGLSPHMDAGTVERWIDP